MSNLEQYVPSLNTCLSLAAKGVVLMTVFYRVRDVDSSFGVVVRNEVQPGQKALCGAPRLRELLQAVSNVERCSGTSSGRAQS